MAIRFEDVNEGLRRIVLSGRLDTAGSEQIARQFAELTESAKGGVSCTFRRSSFSRLWLFACLSRAPRRSRQRAAVMVLHVAENEVIIRTLEATGINELIPTFQDAQDAEKALLK